MWEIAYCDVCSSEFFKRTSDQTTCANKECRKTAAEIRKKAVHWSGRQKLHDETMKKIARDNDVTNRIKMSIIREQVANNGFTYCEICGPEKEVHKHELHHIVYRSEARNHPKKHSRINTILLCRGCHVWIHERKENRDFLIVERKLWETFPDLIRKEAYFSQSIWRVGI